MGIGFSLGANVLAKLMGEDGDSTPLLGAMPVGTPWDLLLGSQALETGFIRSTVYSRVMAGNLTRVISKHMATLALDPSLQEHLHTLLNPPKEYPDKRDGVKPQTLRFVDDVLTRLAGGYSKPYGLCRSENVSH